MPYVGQPVKRFEDPRLVTGQGEYVDDVKLPGMTYAAFLRSPHAHAIIKSIDTTKASQMPGVEMVITGADLEGQISGIETRQLAEWEMDTLEVPDLPALANRKTFFVGETIACVIATERAIARDAVELIEVDYEPLPPILDPLEGADENSIPVHEKLGTNVTMRKYHDRQGEGLDDAFQRADRIVSQQYIVQRIAPFPMETRGCVAYHSPEDDLLTVWASTQGAHRVRDKLVQLLQLPREKVRVITNDVGGGFGEKGGVFPEDLVIAFAALRLHKPINWIADRRENMLTFHGRGHTVDMEVAVQNDGTLLAIRMKNVVDGGAFCGNSTTTPPYTSSHRIVGPYRTPAARVEVVGVITNKGPSGAYRGAGGPESAYCMERTMDLIARELDLDPVEVRRKNFIPPEAFPYQTPTGITYDSGEYEKSLDRALELSDYYAWRERAQASKNPSLNPDGPLIGVGLATVVKMAGAAGEMRVEDAWLNIEPSGKVVARTGVSPHGQGSDVCFAQIVADELGVTPFDVEVLHGDTDVVPDGGGTGATRGMAVGGSAMSMVAKKARVKIAQIAAHRLGCAIEEVVLEEGQAFHASNPHHTVSFPELASSAFDEELLPPNVEVGLDFYDKFTLGVPYYNPHSFAAHIAVVEVDRDTGDVKVLHYTGVHDCGTVINPMVVEGQVHGAIGPGIGQALVEGMQFGPDGQPLTATALDYALPIAEESPTYVTDTIETPSPLTPTGAKGVGELPTVAAPAAVANAVMDALSQFGVRHIETPITPEKVFRAIYGIDD